MRTVPLRGPPELLRAENLVARPDLRHGFTTRHGGVSRGALASLNLAPRPGERAEALAENWSRVVRALRPDLGPEHVALLHQVHGADVVRVTRPGGPERVVAEADAAWTTRDDVVLAVRTADCVPVLVAAPGGVAVAHAGWRGTAAGVVPRAVQALCEGTGAAPSELAAAVGPCISGAAYEVGPEVPEALRRAGLDDEDFLVDRPGRPHVDLGRAVLAQLGLAGVSSRARVDACTFLDDRFYSHRRDGAAAGRLAGVIARSP